MCQSCPLGRATTATGATECSQCSPGQFQDSLGPCPRGVSVLVCADSESLRRQDFVQEVPQGVAEPNGRIQHLHSLVCERILLRVSLRPGLSALAAGSGSAARWDRSPRWTVWRSARSARWGATNRSPARTSASPARPVRHDLLLLGCSRCSV